MISYYFQVVILALIQGISEFIPVSSSAHLVLISSLTQFDYKSIEIDISLHLGSLIAILTYFWRDLINILENKKILSLIFFGSIPITIIGFILFNFEIIYLLRDLRLIAWTTLIFGILMYYSDRKLEQKNIDNNLNIKNIFIIGLYQVLALIPGVSRSGIVITTCRFFKFNRVDSLKISFYLSIPALAGASILSFKNLSEKSFELNLFIFISIFLSFIFSFLTIKFLLFYLKKFSLNLFVYYRIILSILLFLVAYG